MNTMDHWQMLSEEAENVSIMTLSQASLVVARATDGISLMSEGLEMSFPADNSITTVVQMALLSQNLNSFVACVELAERGYYIQVGGLLRNVYENWLSTVYLFQFPTEAHRWAEIDGKHHPPKEATMRDKIAISKATKIKLKEIHQELCAFSHTDPLSAVTRCKVIGDNNIVSLGVEFSMRKVEGTFYGICSWIFIILELLSKLVKGEQSESWRRRYCDGSASFNTWGNQLHSRITTTNEAG